MIVLWSLWAGTLAFAAEAELTVVAEDFELSSDIERPIRRILVRMFRTYETTLGLHFPDQVPIHIRLVGDRDRYQAQVPGNIRHMQTAGFFSSALGEGVVWRGPDATQTRSTIVHETSHYLLDVAGARVPLWLNEGLANTFGSARSEGNAVWLQPYPQMVDWMQRHRSEVPGVHAMISASPTEWAGWDPTPMGSSHHGFGWALTAFLMSTGHGKKTLEHLVLATSLSHRPEVAITAIDDHYPGGMAQIERDYRAWWTGTPRSIQLPIPVANAPSPGWRTCSDGRQIREGSGMTCGGWVADKQGVMRFVEE